MSLFAAWNALDGAVISMCADRRRHPVWLSFLRLIDELSPEAKEIISSRMLRHAQTPQTGALAEAAPAHPDALHSDQQFVA